ncbi:hypothetical protein B7494_g2443 [Chlorociboria aeruginascens]|nr:hypothetical protein B7494_g2443 [Chlorociboria aeruginascens]
MPRVEISLLQLVPTVALQKYANLPFCQWMDGGEIEKTRLEGLKQTVKHTSRRRRKLMRQSSPTLHSNQGSSDINLNLSTVPERSLDLSDVVFADGNQHDPNTPRRSFDESSEALHLDSSSTKSVQYPSTETNALNISQSQEPTLNADSSGITRRNDIKLLMHFVDYVFPLQFPMYKPTAQEGGRGWLLSLLTNINPLYHAALGLSAFHRQAMTLSSSHKDQVRKDLEKQHALCIQRLQSEILRRDIWLFVSETDNWRLHLTAAIGMIDSVNKKRKIRGSSESQLHAQVDIQTAIRLGWDPQESVNQEHPLIEEQTIFKFLTGVVIYLDVISSATSGTCSKFSHIYDDLIGPSSNYIELQSIFGCDNWVILLITKISALQAATKYNTTAVIEDSRALDIKQSLDRGVHCNSEFIEQLKYDDHYVLSHASSIRVITHVFALASLIYLRITTTGAYDGFMDIHGNVACIIKILGLVRNTDVGRNLTWPMYIAGSVAIGIERDFFRTSFTKDASCFSTGIYSRVLAKLEDIWKNKDANAGWPHGDKERVTNK